MLYFLWKQRHQIPSNDSCTKCHGQMRKLTTTVVFWIDLFHKVLNVKMFNQNTLHIEILQSLHLACRFKTNVNVPLVPSDSHLTNEQYFWMQHGETVKFCYHSSLGIISTLLFLSFTFLATLATLVLIVALGEDTHTPTKLSEVDLAIMIFIQHLQSLPNIICVDCTLEDL